MAEAVKVVVRVRPLSRKEIQDGHEAAAVADEKSGTIVCTNPKADAAEPSKNFTFDAVFAKDCTQRSIYDKCGATVVEAVLAGYNGTIFAYGQTGAGKTFTMEGAPDPPELRGIIPNAFQHIFDKVATAEASQQFLVRASYLEIYNEEIRDLLSKEPKNRLDLKENVDSGVYVKDLTSFVVKSSHEIDQVMQAGKKNRSVGATLMNQGSSRSHAIFTIIVECAESDEQRGAHITVGKLNLVDLAGSERQSKTGATGDRLKEATKINLSLSALGNVISALVDGKSQHIPYRDSKLTRLLQDSLGGNTKTVMCANCGPAGYNYDETVSTLRYANRAKNIKNKPKINEDPKDAMLREFTDEIARLKAQLTGASPRPGDGSESFGGGTSLSGSFVEVERIVEREVLKEVHVGVSEADLRRAQDEAEDAKQRVRDKAERDLAELLEQQAETEEEREQLRADLVRHELERKRASEKKRALAAKLRGMEAKLLKGGQMLDMAAKQEAELRSAQQIIVEKQELERTLAQELARQDEASEDMAERYGSVEDEVDKKTRKLEKLVAKVADAEREVSDLHREFQREREDMLDTIRQLARQIKLKDLVVDLFVPAAAAAALEARTQFSEEKDAWSLRPPLPDARLGKRPLSAPHLPRPETEYARHRKQYDPNPRYKYCDIAALDLEPSARTTQDYEGPEMVSDVEGLLGASIDEPDIDVTPTGERQRVVPVDADAGDDGRGADRRAATEPRPASARPKSASVKKAATRRA
mmetsp:Transcript_19778/g.68112  ORF Transcript_19778/g.68112 Transcript_19778/m.68112 type:complete len:758 (+) Transcript_19778:214-2487(+)